SRSPLSDFPIPPAALHPASAAPGATPQRCVAALQPGPTPRGLVALSIELLGPCRSRARRLRKRFRQAPIPFPAVGQVLPHRPARPFRVARLDCLANGTMFRLNLLQICPAVRPLLLADPDALPRNDELAQVVQESRELLVAGRKGDSP